MTMVRAARTWLCLALLLAFGLAVPAGRVAAQSASAGAEPPAVPREFRAAWIATVGNLDWPSRKGLSTARQQAELVSMLDRLVSLHMNAAILQVRPAADALYQSSIEPWSDAITGEMGRAPQPFYDPLAFAVTEAHRRGLELHAWINPYRAKDPSTRSVSSGHISRTRPDLVRRYGAFLWLDPGDPAVRELTTRVVLDIVRRYDVDAIHMDDYFYPYPEPGQGDFPDDRTWKRYRRDGGTLARADWRRENVNLLVRGLGASIHAIKPWVRFGISPFGLWRPGFPAGAQGLDQFARLYADARKWIREGWVDYVSPQLYWAVDRPGLSYPVLLRWWADQNVHGRHLWPGNYTGKVAFTNASAWTSSEVLRQIRLTRAQRGATGNVHFSMAVFQQDPDSLDERLLRDVYASPALVPATPWLGAGAPVRPVASARLDHATGDGYVELFGVAAANEARARTPASRTVDVGAPWLWVVQTRSATGWVTSILPGATRTHLAAEHGSLRPTDIRVMAVDRLGNASAAVRVTPGW